MPIRGACIYQWRRECWPFLDHRITPLLIKPNRLASSVCCTPSFDFLSLLGSLPVFYPVHSFSTPLVTSSRPTEPAAQQLYYIPSALSLCGRPRNCTSCLEQPVLYRFTSLHCMSPSSAQRVHASACAHAPFMVFLSVKAADLRS